MQISERGQVTIPLEYRTQFGFLPNTEVEFIARNNELVLVRKHTTQKPSHSCLAGAQKNRHDDESTDGVAARWRLSGWLMPMYSSTLLPTGVTAK